ncbi:hypothetical protein F2Q69_00022985 [Brassica cretica]|uniref:Uncharacterized protein n=1 Tax=Brassica cretica TaxID=69181 RepID=A0A8S9QFZ7_BRACR|nr:hypothetical protein F2Q69_00022985 [Brassica cretica]
MRHRFAEEVHISHIVRRVWCQVKRHRLYENNELYSGRRVLTVLIIKLQWQLRSIQNKSEFDTVLGEEHCRQDKNNAVVPARASAELDWSSLAYGRADRAFDPARPSAEMDYSFFGYGVRLSLKLMFESFYRECVEKVSARKCDFRR